MTPRVSVIFPTIRNDRFFQVAIKSLFVQTMDDFEVIFMNQCKERGNFDFEDPRFRFIDATGLPANVFTIINEGIKLAKGKYIAGLSDDDYFFPEMLDILCAFGENQDADLIFSGWVDINDSGDPTSLHMFRNKFSIATYKQYNYLNSSALLIKRQFMLDHNISYYDQFVSLGDHAMIYDCIKNGAKIYVVTSPLMATRRHSKQMSIGKMQEREKDFMKLDDIFHEPDLFIAKRKMIEKINAETSSNNQSVPA